MKPATPSPAELLAQMARIQSMERGELSSYQRAGRSKGNDTYHRLQTWKDGKNHARSVRPEELPALQEALDGFARFQDLSEQYVESVVARTRARMEADISFLGDGSLRMTMPAGPAILVASGSSSVTLTWTPVVGDVQEYVVYRSSPGSPLFNAGAPHRQSVGTQTSYTLTGVPLGLSYYGVRARVRIRNGSGSHFEYNPATWVYWIRL